MFGLGLASTCRIRIPLRSLLRLRCIQRICQGVILQIGVQVVQEEHVGNLLARDDGTGVVVVVTGIHQDDLLIVRRQELDKAVGVGTQAEIQRVYENGRRNSEKEGTRGKFSLKSLNSSNLDTVENNTDNVQIKSDNFKNWFGDWENNPSKASKVVNEDGTPKVVYHGTDKGGLLCV